MNRPTFAAAGCLLVLSAAVTGCVRKAAALPVTDVPVIPISKPVERDVTEYVDFTGQTQAIQSMNVVPRVTGYLEKMLFKEGTEVKAGEVLFEIDPRPYQAQYDQAQGQVLLNEARVKEAKADNARYQALAKTPGAVSQQDLDHYQAVEEEAIASVAAAKASLELYTLDLSFCKVRSQIDGLASRFYYTIGNIVIQDQTLLTTVVQLDPMYVTFQMDEAALERVRRAVNEGKIKIPQDQKLPFFVGLQGETGFPHQGLINFVDNQVTASTGSILVRGQIANPKPEKGVRLLSPGMFTRVHLPIGEPHKALLVIDRALGSDQGLKYVYVALKGEDGTYTAQYRRVTTGSLEPDGLRVIEDGLTKDDEVVVGSIQQVRPKMVITPETVPMPTFGPAAAAAAGATNGEKAAGTTTKGAGAKGAGNKDNGQKSGAQKSGAAVPNSPTTPALPANGEKPNATK